MNYKLFFKFKLNPPESKKDDDTGPSLDLNFNSNGLLYICDTYHSFQIFTESGQLISKQNLNSHFKCHISGFCFNNNALYIANRSEKCIQKCDINFNLKSKFHCSFFYDLKDYDDFLEDYTPFPLCVGPDHAIYIADPHKTYIRILDKNNNLKSKIKIPDENQRLRFFSGMMSLCFGPNDYLYVSIYALNCIQVFDKDGNLKFTFGSKGLAPGEFNRPGKICFGPNELLYVNDTWNHRIQIFDQHGNYQSKIELKNFIKENDISFTVNPNGLIYLYRTRYNKITVLQNTSSQSLYQILATRLFKTKNKHKKIRFY